VRRERERLVREIGRVMVVESGVGPILMARPSDPRRLLTELAKYGVAADRSGDRLRLPVSIKTAVNDRLLTALGLAPGKTRAHRVGPGRARDQRDAHRLRRRSGRHRADQDRNRRRLLRPHAGTGRGPRRVSLRLQCEGDLHTDPHHTIEDSAIALGQALNRRWASGAASPATASSWPMDEAKADVGIDLSGRP